MQAEITVDTTTEEVRRLGEKARVLEEDFWQLFKKASRIVAEMDPSKANYQLIVSYLHDVHTESQWFWSHQNTLLLLRKKVLEPERLSYVIRDARAAYEGVRGAIRLIASQLVKFGGGYIFVDDLVSDLNKLVDGATEDHCGFSLDM